MCCTTIVVRPRCDVDVPTGYNDTRIETDVGIYTIERTRCNGLSGVSSIRKRNARADDVVYQGIGRHAIAAGGNELGKAVG